MNLEKVDKNDLNCPVYFKKLEQISSPDFVDRVMSTIEFYLDHDTDIEVHIDFTELIPTVCIVQENRVLFFKFYKTDSIDEMMFSKSELKMLVGEFCD